jgi:TRAP transporter 4TM/12TM fusion protein
MSETALPASTQQAAIHLDISLVKGFGSGWNGRLLFGIAVAFSAFQILTAMSILILPSQVVRGFHVGFLMLLLFPLFATFSGGRWQLAVAWILGLAAFATGIYQYWFYTDLLLRAGDPTETDLVVGTITLVLLFLAAWRAMGPSLPIISGIFLGYCFFGHLLPAPLTHRGYDFEQVIDHMAFGTEGIYGIPTFVSATFIFLFILFGSFLERAGMIKLFNDLAMGLVGGMRGGPAQVCVMSSAMMGTISGSGIANVVSSGQFTIPLMKRNGFSSSFAGGVEAMSSMGGQIMPPVMGAVAFIMAETLGISYAEVVTAAIIPAILYFATAFWTVHLEAGKRGIRGLPDSERPSALRALLDGWYLILPLAALVYLLFAGYTPLFAGSVGLALTAVLILGGSIALGLPAIWLRVIFWIFLGIAAASFFQFGITAIALLIGGLVLLNVFSRGGRATLQLSIDALAEGAKNALYVGIACAIVGIIVGTMTLTGVGTTFSRAVLSIGEHSLFLSLLLTMIICLILGMGIPTIPNYIITSSLAGPALLELGVPLIISHMFVFYFGIMADLTPPVALAAFAAAPIAKESGIKIGIQAVKIALAGFVVPFMAVYSPELMLQDGGPMAQEYGYAFAVFYIVLKATLAMMLWGTAIIGYFLRPLRFWERVLSAAASGMLIAALPITDEIGFALTALFIGQHILRMRAASRSATGAG